MVVRIGGIVAIVEQAAQALRRGVGVMHIPVMDEHEERPLGNRLDPLNGALVQFLLRDGGIKHMAQARVHDVLIAAPEPDAFAKQRIHGARGVTFFVQDLRQPRRSASQSGFAAVCHHAMRDRVLAGEDRGVRWLGRDARSEHVFAQHALTCQLVDVRAGRGRILIASQVIGAQRIRGDQNDIRFFLHGLPITPLGGVYSM